MKFFGPEAEGEDTETIRTTFRLVVQRSTFLIAAVCLFDSAMFYSIGDEQWWWCLSVSLACLPAYYFVDLKRSFPVFLVTVLLIIAVIIWYGTHVALRFGSGINFHFKLIAILPLIAVSGRMSVRAKWIAMVAFTAWMIYLDYRVTLTPNSPLLNPLVSEFMRALNYGLPLLVIAAVVLHYFQLVTEQQALLKEHATTDPLTGLMNRRRLREVWTLAEADGRRGSFPLSIVLCDVDRFKSINDTYGHDVGDGVLQQLGQALRNEVRMTDSVCRWGGEEFLLLLPHSDSVQAMVTANRIRENIAAMPLQIGGHTLNVTITMGVATLQHEEKFEDAAHRADVALYAGKAAGRNRTMAAATHYPAL
ncbi:GGDEF domain-containing protein [Stenotrophobium rhamnosiphilum]|nr:GGDEF domain-containing protein [Stenotrophobium rhamnosiphilum]